MDKQYLFAYGTLQSDTNSSFYTENKLGNYLVKKGRYSILGKLIHIHNNKNGLDYPGLIELNNPESHVVGTLFEVLNPKELFIITDKWEGYDSELSEEESVKLNFYERRLVAMNLPEERVVVAYVYLLNQHSEYFKSYFIENKGIVTSGNWIDYIKKF